MTCRTVEAGGLRYRFCPDDPPTEADRLRSVVRGLVRDEITELPPEERVAVHSARSALEPRATADGLVGLVGNPARSFPGLDVVGVDIDLTLRAARYLPRRLTGTLGPVAGFPAAFAPLDLGLIALHREGVVLRGRTVQNTGLTPTPVAGVDIDLLGLWSTFPPHDVDPVTVMETPDLVSVFPGLYAQRVSGVDGLRGGALLLAAGQEKRLVVPAAPGGRLVRLTDHVGLGPGDVLALEPAVPGRTEYIVVVSVDGASTDDQPADVVLAHPLALEHRDGSVAVRAVPTFPGPPALLTREGIAGDRVAFVDSLAPVAGALVAEVGGGSAALEYQSIFPFQAVSDADGFYRLPVLSRTAMVMLRAQRLGLITQEPVVSPDYRLVENRVDVVFPIP